MNKKSWENLRDDTLTQCLLKAARLYNELSIQLIREKFDLPGLRASHATLMPYIDFEGSRQTEIARRMGISKQAVGQLIDELIEMNCLKLVPDPKDGRAKLVQFHFDGSLTPVAALEVAGIMEKKVEKKLGKRDLALLKKLLQRTLDAIS